MAHLVHFFTQETFSGANSYLPNTFYIPGSVLRILHTLFQKEKKNPHYPHFTDGEPRLRNLPGSQKRQIWNANRGLSDLKGNYLNAALFYFSGPQAGTEQCPGPEASGETGAFPAVWHV